MITRRNIGLLWEVKKLLIWIIGKNMNRVFVYGTLKSGGEIRGLNQFEEDKESVKDWLDIEQ